MGGGGPALRPPDGPFPLSGPRAAQPPRPARRAHLAARVDRLRLALKHRREHRRVRRHRGRAEAPAARRAAAGAAARRAAAQAREAARDARVVRVGASAAAAAIMGSSMSASFSQSICAGPGKRAPKHTTNDVVPARSCAGSWVFERARRRAPAGRARARGRRRAAVRERARARSARGKREEGEGREGPTRARGALARALSRALALIARNGPRARRPSREGRAATRRVVRARRPRPARRARRATPRRARGRARRRSRPRGTRWGRARASRRRPRGGRSAPFVILGSRPADPLSLQQFGGRRERE